MLKLWTIFKGRTNQIETEAVNAVLPTYTLPDFYVPGNMKIKKAILRMAPYLEEDEELKEGLLETKNKFYDAKIKF